MRWDFKNTKRISKQSCVMTSLRCNRRTKFKQMLAKAESSMNKEMDLVKFLQRQRLTTFTALASLNGQQ